MPFRVLITDHAWPSLDIEHRILGELGAEIAVAETASEAELTTLARDADAILTNWAKVPERALDGAERCLVVARYGVGVDNIPVARATELGILVTNVPDFCTEEVSDHALALLLACARRVVQLDARHGRRLLESRSRARTPALARPAPRPHRVRRHSPRARPEGARPRPRCPGIHPAPRAGARRGDRRRDDERPRVSPERVGLRVAPRTRHPPRPRASSARRSCGR